MVVIGVGVRTEVKKNFGDVANGFIRMLPRVKCDPQLYKFFF